MLNASSVMRKCLKLSEAARTKCSSLIKTPIVCVPQTQNRLRSQKVKFSESVKHLFIYPVTSLHFTMYSKVLNKSEIAEVSVCVSTSLNIKRPHYADDDQNEFCSSRTNSRVSRLYQSLLDPFYDPKTAISHVFSVDK